MTGKDVLVEVEALATRLAATGAALIRERFATSLEITYKGVGRSQPVTELDLEIEHAVRTEVRAAFPRHGVVGEELADHIGDSEWTWAIDPIDGTRNLILGIPIVACSIGVLRWGRPVAGAIAVPLSNVLVSARSGGGTRWNGAPVAVSARDADDGSLGVYSHEVYCDLLVDSRDPMRLGESRWFGSTAWELAMIAGGRLDHGVFASTAIWDVAAGVLLVQEAGGHVLQLDQASGEWSPFRSFGAAASARGWSAALVCGGRSAAQIAQRVRPRAARD